MPGLDPGIHDDSQRAQSVLTAFAAAHHGCRVKPGNDGGEQVQANWKMV
jgi:hypothetical protein